MLYEITQIQQYLARHHGLPLEGEGLSTRIVGEVPDGVHVIPLGHSLTPTWVVIREGRIYIGEKAGQEDKAS